MIKLNIDGIGKVEVDDGFKKLSPEEQQAYVNDITMQIQKRKGSKTKKYSKAETAIISATKGATLGFTDEAWGVMAAPATYLGSRIGEDKEGLSDKSIIEIYKHERDKVREEQGESAEQNPGTATSSELAGSLATPGGLIKQGIKGMAGQGAVAAYGESESETLSGTGEDIASGAAFSAAMGKGFQAIGATAQFTKGKFQDAKEFLTDYLQGKPKKVSTKKEEKILQKVLEPGEAGVLAKKLALKKDRKVTVLELASDEFKGFVRTLAKTSGSKNIIINDLNTKTATSSRRVANLIERGISKKSHLQNIDDLIKERSLASKPFYDKAYHEGRELLPKQKKIITKRLTDKEKGEDNLRSALGLKPTTRAVAPSPKVKPIDPDMVEIYKDPRFRKALAKTRTELNLKSSPTSTESLHKARQMLDEKINTLIKQESGTSASSYTELRSKITNFLHKVSPSIKTADNIFSGAKALENAQLRGLTFNRLRPEEVKRLYKDFSDSEKNAFKIGVKENLMKVVGETTDNVSEARKIFAKPDTRKKLKILFGDDDPGYNRFAKGMLDEIRVFETKARILGGSKTDINVSDEANVLKKIGSGAVSATLGKLALMRTAISSLNKLTPQLDQVTAKSIARILVRKEDSLKALQNIAKKEKDIEVKKAINKIIGIFGTKASTGINTSDAINLERD
jgi:ElaB/YqjD/DUF883 family membrane-anchored ribosome-binding protein